MTRIAFRLADVLGWTLCELAFRAHCRGPFVYVYRAGCWFYGKGTDLGLKCGALVANPKCGTDWKEPQYVRAK